MQPILCLATSNHNDLFKIEYSNWKHFYENNFWIKIGNWMNDLK